MSLLDFFDSQHKKINKAYLNHLIHVSRADGFISEKEKKLLVRLGHRLGFVDEEISGIIENPGPDVYHPPSELDKRIEYLFEVVKITLADGVIHEEERRITNFYAIAAGFGPHESEKLVDLIIKGIHEGLDEGDILKQYRKLK